MMSTEEETLVEREPEEGDGEWKAGMMGTSGEGGETGAGQEEEAGRDEGREGTETVGRRRLSECEELRGFEA